MQSQKILLYSRAVVLFIHLLSGVRFLIVDSSKVDHPIVYNFDNFPYRYFTSWNYFSQIIFLSYALLNSLGQKLKIINSDEQKKRANQLQERFYSIIASSTLFIFIFFWTMWQIDRELLYPRGFDLLLPTWINHAIHTLIIVPVIVEFLFCKMQLIPFATASKLIVTINIIYSFVLFGTYFQHDRWIYNFFGLLNWPLRFFFIGFSMFTSLAIYYVLLTSYNFYWKIPSATIKSGQRKTK